MANRGKITSKSPAQLTWFKNVAKSLGYTTTELVQQMTPSIGEFMKANIDYGKELASDLRDLKSASSSRFKNVFNGNSQISIAKTALKNALDDIKSGKIYNKERQEALHEAEFNFDDSEFGMTDFDFDGDEESKPPSNDRIPNITIKNIQPPISRNSPIVKVMEQQTNAIIRSAQATNDVNITLATNRMILDHKNHARTLQGLQSINDNLSLLVNFHSDSMAKYVAASLKYYEESLKTLNDTLTEIKRANGSDVPQIQRRPYEDPADLMFLPGGGLNLKGYLSVVKKNLQNQFASNPLLAPLKMMFEDTDTLKFLAASPLSFISTKVITTLIPQFVQKSMENLDKTFSNFFPALFMRINRVAANSNNPFIQLFKDIFGIDTRSKSSVDLSKYNKGPIPFDGQTKKAITEVIPSYLRKILAALTGQEEVAYDYEEGKFKTVHSMRMEFERKRDEQARSAFSDAISELKRRSDAFIFQSRSERKAFEEGIDKFFVELAKKDYLVNPILKRAQDGSLRDELKEVFDFNNNPGMLKLFRQLILTLPKNQQMAIFGRNVIEARRNVRQMMEEAEIDPSKYNAGVLFNELKYDDHLERDQKTGRFEIKKGFGLLNQVDKFNLSAVDYLRDIKRILLQGIRVFPGGTIGGGSSDADDILNGHRRALDDMKRQQDRLRNRRDSENRDIIDDYSDADIMRLLNSGKRVISSSSDLQSMSDREIADMLMTRDRIRDPQINDNQRSGVLQWIGRFFKGDRQERFNLLREKIDDILRKPAQLLQSVFDKIDNTLYTLVFGSTEEGEDTSFFSKTMAMLRERFRRFGEWTQQKILDPIHESLFGKEGIITKIKDSQFYRSFTARMKSIGEFMFGKVGADGKRQGGLMSDTANQLMDMWDGMKYYFTGNPYTNRAGVSFPKNENSVFGEVKRIFGEFKTTMKHYLFGDQDSKDPDQKKGVLSSTIAGIKQGFRNFSEALFGPKFVGKKEASESFEEMTKKIKERAPKALAWGLIGGASGLIFGGKLGLLGALLLPGGPIGGAIVGTTVGFLSQSERFKNWLFGEKDANGDRVGGVISKSTQDFLKKNRVGIIGGATVGVAKSMLTSFGLLPSFFLPGGPIAGALMGIGASMLIRSETFQKFMFGEKGADGKRVGGIIQKAFGENAGFKKLIGNVGAGTIGGAGFGLVASKLGILGALLVPGGPIGGAIMGAAAGIALTSDRWKKAIFGEWDEQTGLRKGGLLGKFTNWFKLEVQEPLKLKFQEINLNIKEWFTKSIANPFRDALMPIKTEFKAMTDNLKEMFKTGWENFKTKIGEVFEKNVGVPFGKFMEEKVMKPLRGFLNRIINGIGRIFGTVLSSPFKALNMMASGIRAKQEERGIRKFIDDGWSDMTDFKGRRERGERLGLFSTRDAFGNKIGKGIFGRFYDMYFNSEAREAARYGEHGASYAREEDERIAKRNAEQEEYFARERAKLAEQRNRLEKRRNLGLKYDYENFDEQGRNISRIYNTNTVTSKIGGPKTPGATIEAKLGLSLSELFGEGATIESLSRADRKKLSKAIRNRLTGSALKNFFSVGSKVPGTEATVESSVEGVKDAVEETSDKVSTTITTMSEKITETLREQSTKDDIRKHIVPGVNKIVEILGKATGIFKFKRSARANGIPKVTGENFVPSMEAVEPSTNIGRTDSYEAHLSRTGSGSGKGGGSLLSQIARDVRSIAQEVHGQLDGVGSNVFKIRKLLQGSMGIADNDLTGSANRDRVGLWGKIRRAMYRPFDTIREKLAQGVRYVTEKIKAFADGVKNVTKAIISVPVNIAKSMWQFTKEVGNVIKTSVLEIVKLPGKLLGMAGDALKATVESLKMVGPAISESLKGVAKIFSGAMSAAAHAMIGFGKGVGEFFKEAGAGVGLILKNLGASAATLMGTVGKFLGNALNAITDFTFQTTKTVLDFTLSTVKTVGEKLLDVGNTLFQMVTSPLKFFAQSLGKLKGAKQEVIISGGHLDSVGVVQVIGGDGKSTKDLAPMKVTIVGAEECLPVNLCPDKILQSFKRIFPIPVHLTDEKPTGSGVRRFAIATRTSGSSALSNAMLNALETFDNRDDKEEQTKKKLEYVSRKTADYQLKILKEKEEKELTWNNELKQTALLEQIAKSTTEHKDGWMSIFGPKGLLTTGLLLLLPMIKDLIAWLLGKGNDSRLDADGSYITNSDFVEHAVRGAAKGANHIVNKKLIPATGALKAEAHALKGVAQGAKAFLNSKVIPKVTNTPAYQKVSKAVRTTVTDAKIVGLMAKDKADQAIKFVKDVVTKLLNSSEIVKRIGKSAAAKTLSDILGKIQTAFSDPRIVSKYVPKISAAAAAKLGSAVLTVGTSEIVWGAWNLSTGLAEAHHLFKVNPEDVDWKMRIISSIMKGILGFGFNFIIAILNDILVEVFGIDFIQMLANLMYRYMSDEEDYNKLLSNQEAFKLQVEEYNRINGTNLSVDAYNDKFNKTVGQKVWDAIKGGAQTVGQKVSSAWESVKSGASWLGGKISDGASWIGGKIADGTKWLGSKALEVGKAVYNASPIGAFTNDEVVKRNFNVTGNGTITTGMRVSSSLGQLGETFTFGLLDAEKTTKYIYGAGLKAQEYWQKTTETLNNTWNTVSETVGKKVEDIKTKLSDTWNAITTSIGEKVKAIKESASSIWNNISTSVAEGWDKAKETVGNFLEGIKKDTEDRWAKISAPIVDGWNSMKERISTSVANLVSDAKKKWDEIVKPISQGWSNMKKNISDITTKLVGDAKKMWEQITKPIADAWDGIKKTASEGVKQAKDFFKNMIDSVTSPFSTFFEDLRKKADDKLKQLGFGSGGPQESSFSFAGNAYPSAVNAPVQTVMPEMVFTGYKVTSGYGVRRDPITGSSSIHRGIDLVKAHRSPIPSFTNGQVVYAGPGTAGSGYNNLGNVVAIRDENGFTHVYGHLFQVNMRVGQNVRAGDIVGLQGSTGRSTGSHLHYEVRRGGYGTDVNPAVYLQKYRAGVKDFSSLASSAPATGTDPEPDLSTLDLFGKMVENFNLYVDNVYQGTNNRLTWGSKLTAGTTAASTVLTNFIPRTLQEKIIKKTAELTIGSESGGNYTYGRNDRTPDGTPLSPSIGILQWRGNNARQIMQRMYQLIPNDPDARYFATQVNWNDSRPWTPAEQQRLENYLKRNLPITKKVQDEFAISYIRDTNLGPVYKYGVNTGKIKDPRSIVFLGEIANTGPGHIDDFLRSYTPPTSGPEFPHLYQEFMRKSYWGQKPIYANRLRNAYNSLVNWNPDNTNSGMGGPEEKANLAKMSVAVADRITENLQNPEKAKAIRGRGPGLLGINFADPSASLSIAEQMELNSRENVELLREAIKVLREIAKNTGDTSKGVIELSTNIRSTDQQPKEETKETPNVVVVNGGNPQATFNANPMLGAINSPNQKHQNDYRTAKSIARGRTK